MRKTKSKPETAPQDKTGGDCPRTPCSPSSIVDFIRRYNRWRRGDESLTMESPKAIGEALDAVCDRIETLERWVEEGKRNGARCAEERDRLHDAVREYRDAKGRYHTQKACERLLTFVPENVHVDLPPNGQPGFKKDAYGG